MSKKPHVAFTPQEELTAPMPLPSADTLGAMLGGVPTVLPSTDATVRLTPPSTPAVGSGATSDIKEPEKISGVRSGELQTPLFTTTSARRRRVTPYASILDPAPKRESASDEESVVIEAIFDGTPTTIIDGDPQDEKTAAVAVPTLNIEHRATVLFWLVNLAREQGLYKARAKSREDQDLVQLVRVMAFDDLPNNEYAIEDDMSGDKQIVCKRQGSSVGRKKRLHSIELTIHDWPKFEVWMRKQYDNRYQDMTMLDMLDSEIRVASWTYLDWLVGRVEEKSSSGHTMFGNGKSVDLLNL